MDFIPHLDLARVADFFGDDFGWTRKQWASVWSQLDRRERGVILTHMGFERAVEFIPYLDKDTLGEIFGDGFGWNVSEWAAVWNTLAIDERGPLLTHMGLDRAADFVPTLDPKKLSEVFGKGHGWNAKEWAALWNRMDQYTRDRLNIEKDVWTELEPNCGEAGTRIEVNVYKIFGVAPIWHTGTVFLDSDGEFREYFFDSDDKVKTVSPGCMKDMVLHRTMVRVVPKRAEEVWAIRKGVVAAFHGSSYNLFSRNCDVFTDTLLKALGVSGLDQEYVDASGFALVLKHLPTENEHNIVKWIADLIANPKAGNGRTLLDPEWVQIQQCAEVTGDLKKISDREIRWLRKRFEHALGKL